MWSGTAAMTQPSFKEWRTNSTSTPDGLVAQSIKERQLAALAVYASQQNPDGTTYTS